MTEAITLLLSIAAESVPTDQILLYLSQKEKKKRAEILQSLMDSTWFAQRLSNNTFLFNLFSFPLTMLNSPAHVFLATHCFLNDSSLGAVDSFTSGFVLLALRRGGGFN